MVNVLKDQSLSKYLDSLHMVVRFGCGVSLVGYMLGRDTAQSLGCWQVVALMALSVCYINEFIAINDLIMDFCGDVVCLAFPLCTDHEIF